MHTLLNRFPAVAALVLLATLCASAKECYTPIEWNPKNFTSNLDRNKNFVDDAIDALPPGETVGVILCLNACASADDLARFRAIIGADFVYRSPYISILMYDAVPVSVAAQLGMDPRIAMVEMMRESVPGNDVSTRAARIRSSAEYAGSNVEDVYPALTGAGVNIAIIDTGVDNEPTGGPGHETFPAWKYVAGYDAIMDLEIDPDDVNGHGTAVASAALGTGGTSGIYRGNAHASGLIDMKVGTVSMPDIALARAFDKVIERRVDWNIGVFNLSIYTPLTNSDGTDALSQHINRVVREGVVAVVIAGNNGNTGTGNYISRMSAADFAITVASANDMGTITRTDDDISTYSSLGPRYNDGDGITEDEMKPDVAAYGENIHSAVKNTVSDYIDNDGTSMAAPQVAGLAALILQANPGMDPLSVKELIQSTAEDYGTPGWDVYFGHGIINGYAAINGAVNLMTDVAFNDYCGNPGNPQWWLSSDIVPQNPNIIEGTPNGITVTIYNNGPTTAANVKVRVGVYDFSNSTADFDICMHTIPSLPPGPYTFTCPWTPQANDPFPPVVHACLKAYIIYPSDTDHSNNCAQRNVNIQQTYSPALFNMTVVNPTGEDAVMDIVTEPSATELAALGWKLDMGTQRFVMAADDCPRIVTVAMEAERTARTVPVNVTVRRIRGQQTDILGGVGLIAKNGNGAPRPPDKTTFAGIRHTSLGKARLRATPAQLTVSNIDTDGDDGVEAWLGQADFWRGTLREFPVSQIPDDAFLSLTPKGSVNGRDGTTISTMNIRNTRGRAHFSVDFQTAARRLMIEVYNGDQVVDRRTNTNGVFAAVGQLPADIRLTPFRSNGQTAYCEVALSAATEIEVLGSTSSTTVTGDRIVVSSLVVPTLPAYVETVALLASTGLPFVLTDEAAGAFERPFRSLGNPELLWEDNGSRLTARRITARAATGVRADVPSLQRYYLLWETPDLRDIPTGAQLSLSAQGRLRGAGISDLGAVWATRVPQGARLAADFATLGATEQTVFVYNSGTLVYATRATASAIGLAESWPNRGGHMVDSRSQSPCFVLSWEESTGLVLADGTAVSADEMHILPTGTVSQLLSVSEVGVYVVGLETVQIIDQEASSALPVSVGTPEQELPFRLHQNYPNPFDRRTVFRFDLYSDAHVELEIFNLLGERVAGVLSRTMAQGTHEVEWQRTDVALPSGTYIYRLRVQPANAGESFELQRQMIILD